MVALVKPLLVLGLGFVAVESMELTPDNWDKETAGKTVLIKFQAPWWGHCKSMKPDWDKLMKNWNKGTRAATSLIADVDCTAAGKPLCDSNGVQGFPTLKWGDPASLEAYEGGRDYDALKKFATESLKPMCSPTNIDLCDDDKKKEIGDLQAMPTEELQKKIDEAKADQKLAETTFEESVKELQATYEKLQKDKEAKLKEIKDSGLGLMQAVAGANKKKKEEL